MSAPTADEQYLLELINADRAAAGVQPLAIDFQLDDAADAHSQWMISTNTFSHTGANGTSPTQRMQNAGFQLTGSWSTGENIAWASLQAPAGTADDVQRLHTNLMNSAPHRANLLNGTFQEVGLGFATGTFQGYSSGVVTEDFAKTGSTEFLTGVAYADANKDHFYEPGEGLGGITVTAVSATGAHYSTTTYAAGGYDLALPTGQYAVSFSGAGIATSSQTVSLGSSNVKLDLVDPAAASQPTPPPSPSPTPTPTPAPTPTPTPTPAPAPAQTAISTSDANYVAAAGVQSITLTGSGQTVHANDAGDLITSNNTLNHLIGGAGADTFVIGRGGDVVTGGGGADAFVFNETPWNGGHITDFSAALGDHVDLTGLLAHSGYTGSNPIGDGYIRIDADAAGSARIWSDLDHVSPGAGWWLVTTLDGVSPASVAMQGDVLSGRSTPAPSPTPTPTPAPAPAQTAVSTSDANYVAAAGVQSITLTGSGQTVHANDAGDLITSNNTLNHLIGGAGADTFVIGRGGDVVTGGGGADAFVFNETPWNGGHITDFSAALGDHVDLTGLLAHSGYTGSNPIGDGYIRIDADAAGSARIWSDLDHVSPGAGWWLVTTLDGVSPTTLHLNDGWITG